MSFIDNEIIRFKNGVSNRPQGDIFNSMGQPDPTIFSEYLNDFLSFNRTITTEPNGQIEGVWNTSTFFGTANTGIIAYFGGTQGIGGRILCITGATLDDDLLMQFGGSPVSFTPGRKTFFKLIANLEEASDPDVSIGFLGGGGFPPVPTTGVYFRKPSGSNVFDLFWNRSGAGEVAMGLQNQPTLVDENDFEISLYFDGTDRIWAGINGTALGTARLNLDEFPFSSPLTPYIYIQNGVAAARRIDIDLIYWAQERVQIGLEL